MKKVIAYMVKDGNISPDGLYIRKGAISTGWYVYKIIAKIDVNTCTIINRWAENSDADAFTFDKRISFYGKPVLRDVEQLSKTIYDYNRGV